MTKPTRVNDDATTSRPTPACPPWCAKEHIRFVDSDHVSAAAGVELSAHKYEVNGETANFTMIALLTQERDEAVPVIEVSGHHQQLPGDVLTLDEAERFGRQILELVAAGRSSRPCPAWCGEEHHPGDLTRLHRRLVDRWTTDSGETRVMVIRYDGPDGPHGPAQVQSLGGGNPVSFTATEARQVARLFGGFAVQREDLTETARIGRAYAVAADLIDQE